MIYSNYVETFTSLSSEHSSEFPLIWFVSRLLAGHRREIGTRKGARRLGCYKQAVFALARFRDKGGISRLGRGFGLSQSTAYRHLDKSSRCSQSACRAWPSNRSAPWPRARRTG